MATVPVGIKAPRTITLTYAAAESLGISLSTVTAASIAVRKPGETATWTASITAQSASSITIRHSFAADGLDVDVAGEYFLRAWLTIPSGVIETDRLTLVAEY